MRPHLLELEAFTAFPGRVRLDLDDLAQGGLLLLCGETGGGKTALLDALGFALYGVVPGERAKAKDDLRSHHAPARATTWARLEFTARGRRLRVTRSPAQQRPRARGTGTVTDQPRALLEQWDGSRWQPLAQRLDDVGLEVGRLLGMDASQFFQVVMLPQGRFAAFLHAKHEERERLLKQLFHVDRFERVEAWLAERAAEAARRSAAARSAVQVVAHRAAQAAGAPVPELGADDPVWSQHLLEVALRHSSELQAVVAACADQRAAAVRELHEAERTAARQAARRRAESELAELEQARPQMSRLATELTAAESAAPVVVAARRAQDRREQAEAAAGEEQRARAAAAALGGAAAFGGAGAPGGAGASGGAGAPGGAAAPGGSAEEAPAVLRAAAAGLRTEAGRLQALREVEERASGAAETARSAGARQALLQTELERVQRRAGALPATREQAALRTAAAREAELAVPVVQREQDALQERLRLARQLGELATARPGLEASERRAAVRLQRARADAQQIRVRRIDAAAAELAAALTDDAPCPVCGAVDHPDPVEPGADHVSREVELAAQAAADDAAGAHSRAVSAMQVHEERLREVHARLAQLGGGEQLPALEDLAGALRQRAAALRSAAADRVPAEQAEAALLTEAEQVGVRVAGLAAELDQVRRRRVEAQADAARLSARLQAELGDDVDVRVRQERVTAAAGALERAAEAAGATAAARQAERDAVRTAEQLAGLAGLAALDEALAAARPTTWQRSTRERLRAYDESSSGLRARLASEELAVATDPPAPVQARAEELAEAVDAHEAALAQQHVAVERATQLDRLAAEHRLACEALPALQQDAGRLQGLAELAAGRGTNRLSMPLSTFVLAARLEEVALAASARLSRMSGGRYVLVHSDIGRDRRSRAGLGLQVEDGWTGRRRDTATLSGGETFMTALALALGLADVVTAESGGQSIDALFVDEGFGTLDARSLDQVMDVLDDLRSGGRLVGLVSHVADLRQRIPAQVHVLKGSTGSTVRTS